MTLEKGKKYTRFGVGESMPMCFRSEFTVKDVYPDGTPVISFAKGRKRFLLNNRVLTEDTLIVEGWGLKPLIKPEVVVNGSSTWSMDGNITFANTTLEEVKALVKRNLNENFTKYGRVVIYNEKPVLLTEDPEMMQECSRALQRKMQKESSKIG